MLVRELVGGQMAKDDDRQELERLKEENRLLKRLKYLREVERQLKEMPQKGVGVVLPSYRHR